MSSLNLPWVLGDFNSMTDPSEYKDGGGHSSYYSKKSRLFTNFIAKNKLLDVSLTGLNFTWCNNQSCLARCWARLDRCLVNSLWSSNFDSYFVCHLPKTFFDHAPIFLTASPRGFFKSSIFCFDNYWFDYISCHSVVKNIKRSNSNASPMHAFAHLVAQTRSQLIGWRSKGMNSLETDINCLEIQIKAAKNEDARFDLNDPTSNNLSVLYNKYVALQR